MSNEETTVENKKTKANENLVTTDKKDATAPTIEATPNGTIGTSEVAPKLQPTAEPKKVKEQLVALYSPNNRFWDDVGRLEKGYNFVKKEVADKWLTQEGVRKATPEEVKLNLPVGDEN